MKMTNKLFDRSSPYGGDHLSSASNVYIPRSVPDSSITRYLRAGSDPLSPPPSDHLKYSITSSMYLSQSETLRYSSAAAAERARAAAAAASWPPASSVDDDSVDPFVTGMKRPSEVLYHQTLLGAYNTIAQSEAWYSTNSLAKRPRYESARNLPIYPQRPGEKDCAHYMLTRTCKFGDTCKFDHPVWVPEGGISDWKEVPPIDTSESFPERPGEPDCPYFLKTQKCKYGLKCKFNHPKQNMAWGVTRDTSISVLPERPMEPTCAFYMKTGKCKFGSTCKFHHPKDIPIPLSEQDNGTIEQTDSEKMAGNVDFVRAPVSVDPAPYHNSKGLPLRPGEVDCPFYLKTGSCKYGATCRYNHPDRSGNLDIGIANPAASIYQTLDPRLTQQTLGTRADIYPQRPGHAECDYYMKTGECKFAERCKFHHPIDRSVPISKEKQAQQSVKLTLAGLPRREDADHCPYYMKTGTCKYGATCKFDHPPPGEVLAMAASQGVSTSDGIETETALPE